jgi:hypothetical protein
VSRLVDPEALSRILQQRIAALSAGSKRSSLTCLLHRTGGYRRWAEILTLLTNLTITGAMWRAAGARLPLTNLNHEP